MYDMYGKHILDHGMNPRSQGILVPADVDYDANNPSCGDHMRLTLRFDENQCIAAIAWAGESCTISQAAGSMLGEVVLGKSLDEVRQISTQTLFDMLGTSLSKNRLRCALLPFRILVVALDGPEEWHRHELEDEERI